jgi:hypothetical protein
MAFGGMNPANGADASEYAHVGKSYDPALAAEFAYTRNRGTDTEHERKAIGGQAGRSQDMMKSLMTQKVMDQVMQDKMLAHGVQQAIDDAWHMKGDEEDRSVNSEEQEEMDKNEDDVDNDLAALRARRLAKMKNRAKKREELKAKGHGEYTEITEDEFLKMVTASEYVVCHFYHRNFESCKVADMHLRKLAVRCFGTRFITLNAEKAPFFVGKLRIQTLPTIVLFKDGVAQHHMRGFEELGNTNEFKTAKLARLLYMHEIVEEHFDSDEEFF